MPNVKIQNRWDHTKVVYEADVSAEELARARAALQRWRPWMQFTDDQLAMRAAVEKAVSTRAVLTGADLTGADLTRAVLTGAVLTRADLTGAVLTGADLTGADLTGA